MSYTDPYGFDLQGGSGNFQGSSPALQGGTATALQPAAAPMPQPQTPQPRQPQQQNYAPQPPVQSFNAPNSPLSTLQPLGPEFSPHIGTRMSAVSPGTVEYYNKLTGAGFSDPQHLFQFATTVSGRPITSFDQLHGSVNNNFTPVQTSAQYSPFGADPNQTSALNAGAAGLSVDDFKSILGSQNPVTQDQVDAIKQQLGIPQLEQSVFSPPSQTTEQLYNDAYNAAGLGDIKQQVLDLNTEINSRKDNYVTAQGNINENPFLDEASRTGRISRLNDQAGQYINNLIAQQQQLHDQYNQGLNDVNGLVTRHTNDFNTTQQIGTAKLNYLQQKAEQNIQMAQAANLSKAYRYLPAFLQGKAQSEALKSPIGSPEVGYFVRDPNNPGGFKQVIGAYGEPVPGATASPYTPTITNQLQFNQSAPQDGFRTDRNNNPTAMTTDVAKSSGLIEGKDYVQGDPFTGTDGKTYYTAKLLGDPIQTTVKALDNGGFYTQSGQQRWSHTAIPKAQWDAMTPIQKANTVAQMYQREGGSGSLLKSQGTTSAGGSGSVIDSTAQQIYSGNQSPDSISSRDPAFKLINDRVNQISMAQTGKPFDFEGAQINYANKQAANKETATKYRDMQNLESSLNGHLDRLLQLSQNVPRTDSPAVNERTLAAQLATTGNANIAEYLSTAQDTKGELSKLLAGGGAPDDSDKASANTLLNEYLNHDSLKAVIDNIKQLAHTKTEAYKNLSNVPQYSSNGGGSSTPDISNLF